jgi:hypothetical protein
MSGFGDREAYDVGSTGELIWTRPPTDFGKPGYATRRARQITEHMAALAAEPQHLGNLFDRSPSRELRNYLWVHRAEHIEVARQLISILPAATLMEILRYQ